MLTEAVMSRLEELSSKIHEEISQADTSWYRIGECLSEAKALIPEKPEFGKWCREQKFGRTSDTLQKYRKSYDFIQEHVLDRNVDYYSILKIADHPNNEVKQHLIARLKAGEKLKRSEVMASRKPCVSEKTHDKPKSKLDVIADKVEAGNAAMMAELQAMRAENQALRDKLEAAEAKYQEAQAKVDAFEWKPDYVRSRLEDLRLMELKEQAARLSSRTLTAEDYRALLWALHPDVAGGDEALAKRLAPAMTVLKKMEPIFDKPMTKEKLLRSHPSFVQGAQMAELFKKS